MLVIAVNGGVVLIVLTCVHVWFVQQWTVEPEKLVDRAPELTTAGRFLCLDLEFGRHFWMHSSHCDL